MILFEVYIAAGGGGSEEIFHGMTGCTRYTLVLTRMHNFNHSIPHALRQ